MIDFMINVSTQISDRPEGELREYYNDLSDTDVTEEYLSYMC